MTFQITDFPRILPELMLIVLGLFVLGSDVFERWGTTPEAQRERIKASAQLTLVGLGLILVVALVQSGYLFQVGDPLPDSAANRVINAFINLARNLQAAGPLGESPPVLGALATDHLTMVARLLLISAALLTVLLAYGYQPSGNPGEFYALILFATSGMALMAAATELIVAYLAVELSSISLYILAGYFRNDERSVEAGLKYFVFGALSSGILLYGMSLAYGYTASVNASTGGTPVIATLFSEIGRAGQLAGGGGSPVLTLALLFVVAGIGYKIAVVPFHGWSPDVYQGAPTPITAFISTASKTAGFLLLYRVLATAFPALAGRVAETFGGWTSLLALLALVTILVGNLSALPQMNAKRLLAYSSIGHAGFALMALVAIDVGSASDSAFGTASLMYYLLVYTLTNLGAFGALAVIGEALGGDDMAHLNGLWRRNLGLATMLTVLVLSLAGIPPLSGFWAKFFVFMSAYRAGAIWLVVVAVVMTIVSLYYYLRFLKVIWINTAVSDTPVMTPPTMNATLIISTLLVLLLGIFPNAVWGILNQVTLLAAR